jgi:hypothetical protein
MPTDEIAIERNALARSGDLSIGIMTIKPDDTDPAVRLSVSRISSGESARIVLRPGSPVAVLAHRLDVVAIDREGSPAVRLKVTREDASP